MNMNDLFRQLDNITAVSDSYIEEKMQTGYLRRMEAKRRQMHRLSAREVKERLRNGACPA